MDIKTLKYFLAVAREENLTRAAQILFVSQPALSKSLKELEEELGKKLFTRKSSGIKLTDAGILLCNRATEIVNLSEKILSDFKANEILGGEIYFGLAESFQIRYLAREIRTMKNFYPKLNYHIISGDTEQVIGKLDNGLLDFAVLAEKPNFDKYNFLQFPEADKWGLLMRADDKLAEKKFITFEDLIGLPLFCSEQARKNEIAAWCQGRIDELYFDGSFKLMYNGAIFVSEKLGYLLTFDKLTNFEELVFRPLYPKLETELYLIWKKFPKFSPIAEKFLERIKISFSK